MAASRDWEHVSAGMRRQLLRPYTDLGWVIALIGLLFLWGRVEPGVTWVAVALAVLNVPGYVAAVRERRARLARSDGELFVDCAREIEGRFRNQVLVLLFGVPALIGLIVLAFVLSDWTWPVVLAIWIALYLPMHLFVRMRGTAHELVEAKRWTRLGEPAGNGGEAEDALDLTRSRTLRSFWLFVLYLGPPLCVLLIGVALLGDDPRRAWTTAGVMAALWVLVWRYLASAESDE